MDTPHKSYNYWEKWVPLYGPDYVNDVHSQLLDIESEIVWIGLPHQWQILELWHLINGEACECLNPQFQRGLLLFELVGSYFLLLARGVPSRKL